MIGAPVRPGCQAVAANLSAPGVAKSLAIASCSAASTLTAKPSASRNSR